MTNPPSADLEGFRVRYSASLFINGLRVTASLVTNLVLAVLLGPGSFGELMFLVFFFTAWTRLVDLGTSNAFFTFIARARRPASFYWASSAWLGLQVVVSLAIIWVLVATGLSERIWPSIRADLLYVGFLASFTMNRIWQAAAYIGESLRKSVMVQLRNLALAVAYLGAIALASMYDLLTVRSVLLILFGLHVAGTVLFLASVRRRAIDPSGPSWTIRETVREYRDYAAPLAISIVAGSLLLLIGPALLQSSAGSEQQGYYALGERIAGAAFLIVTPMVNILWKEIAAAHETYDHARMKRLYAKTVGSLFMITAVGCAFLSAHAMDIVRLTVGAQYSPAVVVVAVATTAPMFQALAQLHTAILLATQRTRASMVVDLVSVGAGMVGLVLLVSHGIGPVPGLALGALGYAWLMVVVSVAVVVLQSEILRRQERLPALWWKPLALAAGLLLLANAVRQGTGFATGSFGRAHPWLVVGLSALIYGGVTIAVVYRSPWLAGLHRDDIREIWTQLRRGSLAASEVKSV